LDARRRRPGVGDGQEILVSARGRISADLVAQYEAATGGADAA
jgi:hypothetical protein